MARIKASRKGCGCGDKTRGGWKSIPTSGTKPQATKQQLGPSETDKKSSQMSSNDCSATERSSMVKSEQNEKEDKQQQQQQAKVRRKIRFWKPRKNAGNSRKDIERIQMMFVPSDDPYDKPLRWWEEPHIKYA
ncbi:hypothetical protein TKK_0019612 [Trichogramma kaykai]|uniref:Uncharacterized protein n=1 Tax=Trichogramma kaykai TaxID=54128 RepID=A0ABD2VRZ7_9HYME